MEGLGFWTIDFSPLTAEGSYVIEVSSGRETVFPIP